MGRCLEVEDTRGAPAGTMGPAFERVELCVGSRSRGSTGLRCWPLSQSPHHGLATFVLLHRQSTCSCCLSDRRRPPTSSHFILSRHAQVCSSTLPCPTLYLRGLQPLVSFSPRYYSSKNTGPGHHCYSSKHTSVLSRSARYKLFVTLWTVLHFSSLSRIISKNTGVGKPVSSPANVCRY